MRTFETLSEALGDLAGRGYTLNFSLQMDKDCLVCRQTTRHLFSDEFEIDEVYRFEDVADSGDEMIACALSSSKYDVKGVVLNPFSAYADDATSKIIRKLKIHLNS